MQVALAASVAEETHAMQQFASDFIFAIQREVIAVDHLQSVSADIASAQLMSSLSVSQNIELTCYQAVQLRKMASLLEFIIRNTNTSVEPVTGYIRRVKVGGLDDTKGMYNGD